MRKIHLNKVVKRISVFAISAMLIAQVVPMASSASATGDVNGDGKMSVIDLVTARKDGVTTEMADMNGDGKINGEDYHMMRKAILNGSQNELDGVMEVLDIVSSEDIAISGNIATVIMKNTSSAWEAENVVVTYTVNGGPDQTFNLGTVKPGVTKTFQIENVTESATVTVTNVTADYWSVAVK